MVFLKYLFALLILLYGCSKPNDKAIINNIIKNQAYKIDKYTKSFESNSMDRYFYNKNNGLKNLMLNNKTLYIKIYSFTKGISNKFKQIVLEKKPNSIIIDLRDNPGGLLTEAIKIVDMFKSNGVIITTKSSNGIKKYQANIQNTIFKDIPTAIIINKNSASASEILAGALKGLKNVYIIGEPSYGKGSIQNLIKISNNKYVKVTISEYKIHNNIDISNIGVQPDIRCLDKNINLNNIPPSKIKKIKTYLQKNNNLDRCIFIAYAILN